MTAIEFFSKTAYHVMTGTSPYLLMHGTPREITTIIKFPEDNKEGIGIQKYYNKIEEKVKLHAVRYKRRKPN